MPDIKDSVGDGGANKSHDVALVQAMLRLVKDAKNNPYLAGSIDGGYGKVTKGAISAFQTDHKLIDKSAKEKLGLVLAGEKTIQKLHALLPDAYKDMRVLEDRKTVYLPAAADDAKASESQITSDAGFDPSFRANVAALVRQMFETHKIVLWVTPTGRRRTFEGQFNETKTEAGPGESNHNFGRATDIGFGAKKFHWIQGDGSTKADADWLNALEKAKFAEAMAFWDARDALAGKLNLHRLQMERVHLQSFDQKTVSSGRSLVKLLNSVGKMQWKANFAASAWNYSCDLGSGGKHWENVGTARQIWSQASLVSKTAIAKARSAATGKAVKEADVKMEELAAMKKALKADFESADANWIKWSPVP
jgi:hypothetical protein